MALLLASSVLVVDPTDLAVAAAEESDIPEAVAELLEDKAAGGPEALEWDPFEEPVLGEVAESEGVAPLGPGELPEPGTAGPVTVVPASDGQGTDGVAAHMSDGLEVEVVDHAMAEAVGASGFVFEVTDSGGEDGVLSEVAAGDSAVELVVDYSDFAGLYGGGFVDRLEVVVLPGCAFADEVDPESCDLAGTKLPAEVDHASETLVAEVDDLAELMTDGVETSQGEQVETGTTDGGDGAAFAVTADVSGESGSWAATQMPVTGEWSAGMGSGEFSYGYDMDLPEPSAGGVPSVGLGYSSGSVDGLTNATNPQASAAGLGWSDFGGAFIERRYQPCVNTDSGPQSLDLCWQNQNGVLSLGDVSGTLLPLDDEANEWAVHSDAGWRIERLTGADNGAYEGEHWKVTATDGTEYFFGLGTSPEHGSSMDSTLTVPVFATHENQPCWDENGDLHACDEMAYRWSLDRVVDPDGNVTTYYYDKEVNRYRALHGFAGDAVYDRAQTLSRIAYGGVEDWANTPAAQVSFGREYRCHSLDENCADQPPKSGNGLAYPDVPNDLICEPSDTPCGAGAPSFFSTRRYSHVKTEVLVTGEGFRPVTQYNLNHTFMNQSGATHHKLYLANIQENGISQGDWLNYAPTSFNYDWMANRADVDQTDPAERLSHARMNAITNPHGGITLLRYGQNRPCAEDWRPEYWSDNDRDCFPQTSHDDGQRRVGVFHKWLVEEVVEVPQGDSPNMSTEYAYEGDPGWVFNYGSFAQYDHNWGWSSWRGYGTTTVTQGDSVQRVRAFRGLDGDPLMVDVGGGVECPCGHRDAEVETFDGTESYTDHRGLAGQVLEEATIDGGEDAVSMRYGYERRVTHEAGSGQGRDAEWVAVDQVTERVADGDGGFAERVTETSYDDRERPVATIEHGWADDEQGPRCSVTTYAENPDAWMFTYPASNQLLDGDCDTGEVLEASETYYDGSEVLGEIGDHGRATLERVQIDGDAWAETTTSYDVIGRPVSVTDPEGATSEISRYGGNYNAVPTLTVETDALGHETSTQWLPEYGVPTRVEDPNGNVTTSKYDALGRLQHVWLPTEQPEGSENTWPSYAFSYYPDADERKVQAIQLAQGDPHTGDGVVYEAVVTFYDGLWRERQVQAQSPTSGHMIAEETTYNDRGLVLNETAPQAIEGTPGDERVSLLQDGWDNRTRFIYDPLERPSRVDDIQNGEVVRETTTSYTYDTTTVTDAEGNQSRERLDGFGRTVAVEEHDGDGWVSSSYGFDLADRLTSVTDPEGNRIEYDYNLAGWRTAEDDPNRGASTFTYDQAGRVTATADAEGNEIHVAYDDLGRQTERRSDGADGELLAAWEYDSAPGGIGLPHREVRPGAAEDEWVSEVTGYDARGRPEGTTLTVPDSIDGLGGDYTFSQTYDRADRVVESTMPEVGGLAEETVTTGYDELGYAREFTGLDDYVSWTVLDDRGRRESASHGAGAFLLTQWSYNDDQMPERATTDIKQSDGNYTALADYQQSYDDAGNVTDRAITQSGQSWRECYGYDTRYRLTAAHTVDIGDDCDSGTPGGGDQAFEHSYTYSPDGNLLERAENGESTSYTYPGSGEDRPHAPVTVGGEDYSWDDNGNLVERTTGDDGTETFTWDAEQRLASVEGDDATTEFFYDVGGQRLLRQTDDGTTLYLAGHEVTVDGDGEVVDAVRPYEFAGELVATRSISQGLQYTVSDGAGSVSMAIDDQANEAAGSRTYDPYGAVREEDGEELATDRGFLGQVEDPTTNLSYLNERYYDTDIGVFISADPVYKTDNLRTLNPYSYAGGNPATYADPTGMSPSYIFGLEQQNRSLQKSVAAHQKLAQAQQAIIADQQSYIAAQARLIGALQDNIARLQYANTMLKVRILQLNYANTMLKVKILQQGQQISFLEAVARWQGGVIRGQENRIGQLQGQVKGLQNQVAGLQYTIYQLKHRPSGGGGGSTGGGGGGGMGPKGGGGKTFSTGGSMCGVIVHCFAGGNPFDDAKDWWGCQWGTVSQQFQGKGGSCGSEDAAKAVAGWPEGFAAGFLKGSWVIGTAIGAAKLTVCVGAGFDPLACAGTAALVGFLGGFVGGLGVGVWGAARGWEWDP